MTGRHAARCARTSGTRETARPEALASSVLGGLVTLIESEASFVDRPVGSPLLLDFREKLAVGPRRMNSFTDAEVSAATTAMDNQTG